MSVWHWTIQHAQPSTNTWHIHRAPGLIVLNVLCAVMFSKLLLSHTFNHTITPPHSINKMLSLRAFNHPPTHSSQLHHHITSLNQIHPQTSIPHSINACRGVHYEIKLGQVNFCSLNHSQGNEAIKPCIKQVCFRTTMGSRQSNPLSPSRLNLIDNQTCIQQWSSIS